MQLRPCSLAGLLCQMSLAAGVARDDRTIREGTRSWTDVAIRGKPHSERWVADLELCIEDCFPTLGLQLRRGRLLSQRDVDSRRYVAVVNETLARKYFGAEDPIGQKLKFEALDRPDTLKFFLQVARHLGGCGLGDPALREARLSISLAAGVRMGCSGHIGPFPNARLRPRWSWPIQNGGKHREGDASPEVNISKRRLPKNLIIRGRHASSTGSFAFCKPPAVLLVNIDGCIIVSSVFAQKDCTQKEIVENLVLLAFSRMVRLD